MMRYVLLLAMVFSFTVVNVEGQSRKPTTPAATPLTNRTPTQQPLMTDYKGVRIGMTADEAHAKLGKGLKVDEQEFYVFSDRETAQLVFDDSNKVTGISVDYLGGVGAPDYRTVVGPDINVKPDGSMYKMVRYDNLGFWVSYNRTADSSVIMVSITIQKQR
ncbi:MAG TPA: hypothetical protein VLA93_08595 [Pyrinomonadaceae bacterium]|nr:hypothetical protein [Pyrinomonadaceae bacterium]